MCPPTRLRDSGGTATVVALVEAGGVGVKISAAAALGVALASGAGFRIRTSPFPAYGSALVTGAINKLALPALVPGPARPALEQTGRGSRTSDGRMQLDFTQG